jgi:hypothetical protein
MARLAWSGACARVAQAFGSAGVIGSICGDDFASSMGAVIRATAEKL